MRLFLLVFSFVFLIQSFVFAEDKSLKKNLFLLNEDVKDKKEEKNKKITNDLHLIVTITMPSGKLETFGSEIKKLEIISHEDGEIDMIHLVLGNKNSSNSVRLAEISALTGIPTYRISDKNELNIELIKNYNVIGITAGASTPEVLVKELIKHLKQNFGYNIDVEILDGEQEKVSFKLPEIVR